MELKIQFVQVVQSYPEQIFSNPSTSRIHISQTVDCTRVCKYTFETWKVLNNFGFQLMDRFHSEQSHISIF
jgi:hypothetical protein